MAIEPQQVAPAASGPHQRFREHAVDRVRRRLGSPPVVLVLAALAAGGAVAVVHTGGVTASPSAYAGMAVWGTGTFVVGGLLWRARGPDGLFSGLFVAIGFLIAAAALAGSANTAAFTVGLLAEQLAGLLTMVALVIFPSGRATRAGRIALGVMGAYVVAGFMPWLLLEPHPGPLTPLARCAGACPGNVLYVGGAQWLADAGDYLLLATRLALEAAVVAALVLRMAGAPRPQRWLLLPLAATGVGWMVMQGGYGVAVHAGGPDSPVAAGAGFGLNTARALLAAAFLTEPLMARAFSGVALQRMLRSFERASTPAERERVIAETLDDPGLRIAFWLPRSKHWVGTSGQTLELPSVRSTQVWTPVVREGHPIAAVIHDRTLTDSPEVVEAAGRALLLTLDDVGVGERVERDLRESRRRLLAADTAERRRLERDLHRTAQQHLVAVRVGLELARGRAEENDALVERLTALEENIDRTVEDVRRVASGLYTPVLEERGLKAALQDMSRWLEKRPRLELENVGRLPPELEACVYFCIVEAIGNATEHAGADAEITVRLGRDADGVRFAVSDDGRGFDPETVAGAGLAGIADRAAAFDGSAEIVSSPGSGTVVTGFVPTEVLKPQIEWTPL